MLSYLNISAALALTAANPGNTEDGKSLPLAKDEKFSIVVQPPQSENTELLMFGGQKTVIACGDDQDHILNILSNDYQRPVPDFKVGNELHFYETFTGQNVHLPNADIVLIIPHFKDSKIENASKLAEEIIKIPRKSINFNFLVIPEELQLTDQMRNHIAVSLSVNHFVIIRTMLLNRGASEIYDRTTISWRFSQGNFKECQLMKQFFIENFFSEYNGAILARKANITNLHTLLSNHKLTPSHKFSSTLEVPVPTTFTQPAHLARVNLAEISEIPKNTARKTL